MLVLSHYLQLNTKLSELPQVDNIARHGVIIEGILCDLFLAECGDALKYEIYQDVLDTDEITPLLIKLHSESNSFDLFNHVEYIVHIEAAKYIDDMLGQVEYDYCQD